MKHIKNLTELLADSLGRILASEREQLAGLPWVKGKANSPVLIGSINNYREAKERNIERLNLCFDMLGIVQPNDRCELTVKLIDNCQFAISRAAENHVGDASLIATIQQIAHFNIVNYGTAAAYAATVGRYNIARILHDALEDEKEMDVHLSDIAKETVNPSAVFAVNMD